MSYTNNTERKDCQLNSRGSLSLTSGDSVLYDPQSDYELNRESQMSVATSLGDNIQ
jgi:hypothetical protein